MDYWWVNHKQTQRHELRGGYLWSPFRNANNSFNQSYENMRLAKVGDIVFSYANGVIGAVGVVTESASPSPKPTEFGTVGGYWSDEGWLVGVEFSPAPTAVQPRRHMAEIGPLLPSRHSPIRANGHGNQGSYLASIPKALGFLLMDLLGKVELNPIRIADSETNVAILADLDLIQNDASIDTTERIQLARARVGQGLFRRMVSLVEDHCKVTGIGDKRLLIASHIKPWRDSSNEERLNRYNGLMLSPHVDALFDQRLISFEKGGSMLIHPSLEPDILKRWSIDPQRKVAPFMPEQETFLAHHRGKFLATARY